MPLQRGKQIQPEGHVLKLPGMTENRALNSWFLWSQQDVNSSRSSFMVMPEDFSQGKACMAVGLRHGVPTHF